MCTVQDERSVIVCDTALDIIRSRLAVAFPAGVSYATVHGEGTLVQALPGVPSEQFLGVVQAAVDEVARLESAGEEQDSGH